MPELESVVTSYGTQKSFVLSVWSTSVGESSGVVEMSLGKHSSLPFVSIPL